MKTLHDDPGEDFAAFSTEDFFQYEPYFYYALLNVLRTASADDITKGYRQQSRMYHSDQYIQPEPQKTSLRLSRTDSDILSAVEKVMLMRSQQINEAYRVLRDTKGKRIVYDTVCAAELEGKNRGRGNLNRKTIQERMDDLTSTSMSSLSTVTLEGANLKVFMQECLARREVLQMCEAIDMPSMLEIHIEKIWSLQEILRGALAWPRCIVLAGVSRQDPSLAAAKEQIENGILHVLLAMCSVHALKAHPGFRMTHRDGSVMAIRGSCGVSRRPAIAVRAVENAQGIGESPKDNFVFSVSDAKLKVSFISSDQRSITKFSILPAAFIDRKPLHDMEPVKSPRLASISHCIEHDVCEGVRLTTTWKKQAKPIGSKVADFLLRRSGRQPSSAFFENGVLENLFSLFEAVWKVKALVLRGKRSFVQLEWKAVLDGAVLGISTLLSSKKLAVDTLRPKTSPTTTSDTTPSRVNSAHLISSVLWFIFRGVQHQLNFTAGTRWASKGIENVHRNIQNRIWSCSFGFQRIRVGVSHYTSNSVPGLSKLMNGEIPFASPGSCTLEVLRDAVKAYFFTKAPLDGKRHAEARENRSKNRGKSRHTPCSNRKAINIAESDFDDSSSVTSSDDDQSRLLYTSFHPTLCDFDAEPPTAYPRASGFAKGENTTSARYFPAQFSSFYTRRLFGHGEYHAPVFRSNKARSHAENALSNAHDATRSAEIYPRHTLSSISSAFSWTIDVLTGKAIFSQEYMLNRWFQFWNIGFGLKLSLPVLPTAALCILRHLEPFTDSSLEEIHDAVIEVADRSCGPLSRGVWKVAAFFIRSPFTLLSMFEIELVLHRTMQKPIFGRERALPTIRVPLLLASTSFFAQEAVTPQGTQCGVVERFLIAFFTTALRIVPITSYSSQNSSTKGCMTHVIQHIWRYALKPYLAVQSILSLVAPASISLYNAIRCVHFLQRQRSTILKHRAFALEQQSHLFESIGSKALSKESAILLPRRPAERAVCGGLIIRRALYRVRPSNILLKFLLRKGEAKHALSSTHISRKSSKTAHANPTLPPLSLDVTSVLQSLVTDSKLVIHTKEFHEGEVVARRELFMILPGLYDIEPTGSEQKELVIDYMFLGKKHRCVYVDGAFDGSEDFICIPRENHVVHKV